MEQKRLFSIDFLRFFAIFLLTGFHCLRFVVGESYLETSFSPFLHMFKVGALGVEIFFIISAFCICASYDRVQNAGKVFLNRMKRIIPVYYIAILVWVILTYVGVPNNAIQPIDIISHVFFVHNLSPIQYYTVNATFWFLGTLFDFYLIFLIFGHKLLKSNLFWVIFALVSAFAIYMISFYTGFEKGSLLRSVFGLMPCFACGILMYNKQFEFKHFQINYILLVLGLYMLMFVGRNEFNSIFLTKYNFHGIITSILLCISIYNILERFKNIPKVVHNIVSLIAISSFSIYLYNYIFLSYKVISHSYVFVFIYLLNTLGFGILMYYLIEKPILNSKLFKKDRV